MIRCRIPAPKCTQPNKPCCTQCNHPCLFRCRNHPERCKCWTQSPPPKGPGRGEVNGYGDR